MGMQEHKYIETNGIRLHVVQQGPEEGRLVILLHGFPELASKSLEFCENGRGVLLGEATNNYYLNRGTQKNSLSFIKDKLFF